MKPESAISNPELRHWNIDNPIVIEAYWHKGKIILARQQEVGKEVGYDG